MPCASAGVGRRSADRQLHERLANANRIRASGNKILLTARFSGLISAAPIASTRFCASWALHRKVTLHNILVILQTSCPERMRSLRSPIDYDPLNEL
jgi:hypothetical protein